MCAYANAGKAAVVHVLAMVLAVGDFTLDSGVGGAVAPVIGTTLGHIRFLLPMIKMGLSPGSSLSGGS